jgi:methylmalonyl-CoA/ethylmalonyl-CoA epimerase
MTNAHLNGVLQIALTVEDMPRATAFYRDVLGLKYLFGGPNMAFFDCSGVRLYLACGQGTEHRASSNLYFRTNDIAQYLADLKEKNVSIHQEPQMIAKMPDHDLWLMWIRDSESNLLGIMEERAKAA